MFCLKNIDFQYHFFSIYPHFKHTNETERSKTLLYYLRLNDGNVLYYYKREKKIK